VKKIKKLKKKIFFYSTFLSPYQEDFCKKINNTTKLKAVFINKNINNYEIKKNNYLWLNYLGNKNIYKIINEFDPDLIIIGGYKIRSIFQIVFLCLKKKIPYCLWLEYPKNKFFLLNVLRNILIFTIANKAKFILAIGKTAKQFYKNFNNKIINFPYSLDFKNYKKKKYLIHYKNITFIFVGQLIYRKGIDKLLDAFSLLNYKNVYLKILGNGEYKSKIIKLCSKKNNISYLGFLNQKKLIQHLYKSDVLIFPSRFDGWGVTVTQAMAAGLPVVGTKETGAIKDFIRNGFNGKICKTEINSILQSIKYYINNPSKIKTHGQINKDIIFKSFCNNEISVSYFNNKILKLLK
jgi:glycosyltransferase involved in cell wall biosynthesis